MTTHRQSLFFGLFNIILKAIKHLVFIARLRNNLKLLFCSGNILDYQTNHSKEVSAEKQLFPVPNEKKQHLYVFTRRLINTYPCYPQYNQL